MMTLRSGLRDHFETALIFALLLAIGGFTACSAGRPPLFEPSRVIDGELLLLDPEVRFGDPGLSAEERRVAAIMNHELHDFLTERRVSVSRQLESPEANLARSALLSALYRRTAESSRRFKTVEAIGTEIALEPLASKGTRTVLLPLMSRRGYLPPDGESVPRPEAEIIELPDHRPDYVTPMAPRSEMPGVNIELLIVEVAGGIVVTHRKLIHPAYLPDEIVAAMPQIIRATARGVSGPDKGAGSR